MEEKKINASLTVTSEIRGYIIDTLDDYDVKRILQQRSYDEIYDMLSATQQMELEWMLAPENKDEDNTERVAAEAVKILGIENRDVEEYVNGLQNYQKRDLLCDILGVQRTISKEALLKELQDAVNRFA